ncbi:cache domain-containing protein [Cupriavidus basilensis]
MQLRLYAQALESELAHYDYVPGLLTLDERIGTLLRRPGDDAAVARANEYLSALNTRAGTRVVYVLDAHGKVLATSNWQRPDSYLGEDLSFRPYFPHRHGGPARPLLRRGHHAQRVGLLPVGAAGRARQP